MLKKLLLFVAAAFVGTFAFAQNTVETATVIEDITTYEGTDPFVFNKKDRKVYAYNSHGQYEQFGVYERVYTLATEAKEGEVDYIESSAESTRNNVIPTDYIPKTYTRAEGIFEYDSKFFHDWNALFGVGYYLDGWKNLFTYFAQTTAGRGAIQSSDETVDTHGSVTWDKKSKFVLDAETSRGTQYTMDGKILSYIQQNNAPKAMDCVTPIYILGMNKTVPAHLNADGEEVAEEAIVDCQAPGAKFYGLKFFEDDELVRDFVPYVQNGVVGAFDKVTNTFFPATTDEDKTPLTVGTVAVYEGKIVRYLEDNHEYKYTNGAWQDLGEVTMEEIEDETYKDMANWKTNDGHAAIFQDQFSMEDGVNYIDKYIGTGGFEPLMVEFPTEAGADYNLSFNYENLKGSWGWSDWYVRVAVWNQYDLWTSQSFAFNDANVLGNQLLGNEKSEGLVPVSVDFNAAKDVETLIVQFGMYADENEFQFGFGPYSIKKYIYPETYPVINPDDYAEVEPTRWDADGVGYAAYKGGDGANAGESWGNICDNDASTKFYGDRQNGWFMIQADKPVAVKQYSIVTGGDSYQYRNRNPRGWTLEGSNDKENWTMIDKVSDYDLIENINSTEFTFVPSYVPEEETGAKESTSTEEFKYFRFTVTEPLENNIQISEFWINEQAHEFGTDPVETVDPTCCKQGKKVYECADCKAQKTEYIPLTNEHTYGDGCYADEADVIIISDSYSRDNAQHFKATRVYHNDFESFVSDHDREFVLDEEVNAKYDGWKEVDFDDSDWDVLTLPMGDFGNWNTYWGGENNGYLIRMPFTIDKAANVEKLIFQTFHDDNYAAYLNGELISKVVNWNGGNIYDNDNRFVNWDRVTSDGDNNFPNGTIVKYGEAIPLDLLQDGENMLAIYIQENWGGQYFDCRLTAVGVVTGVKNVEVEKTGAKEEVYDLQGRKMNSKNLPKGIYIVNGKKVVK